MTKWVWKDLFQADIPDDWIVNSDTDLIEVLPPKPVGALQISIFNFHEKDLEASCVAAVGNFVEKRSGQLLGELQVNAQDSKVSVSSEFISGELGNNLYWLISAIGWSEKIALVTYCYGGQRDGETQRAIEIIHSISPA